MFGCIKFDQYLHGRKHVNAYTDHKPLEAILAKRINTAPKRLERMILRLQKHHLKILYKRGCQMHISDQLSRSPTATKKEKLIKEYDIFKEKEEQQLQQDLENLDPDIYHCTR